MTLWLNNPPEPSAQPTTGCGSCPCVPRYWRIRPVVVSGLYSVMTGAWVLSRPSTAATKTIGASGSSTITTPGAGTFTVPALMTSLTADLWGAGGGGLKAGGRACGGAGAFCELLNQAVTPGQVISYSIGAAGLGEAPPPTAGEDGGPTTCSTFSLTANGGKGGASGAGGTASGGTTNTSGGAGNNVTGQGGSSPNGGAGGTIASPNGASPGGGGYSDATTAGNGGTGQIKFTYAGSTVVTVYDPANECVWSASHRVDSQTTYYWYLYFGPSPEDPGSHPIGWYLSADVRSLNAPNDIAWWGPNVPSGSPAISANWSENAFGGWNCLSANTFDPSGNALPGFPAQLTIEPYWP